MPQTWTVAGRTCAQVQADIDAHLAIRPLPASVELAWSGPRVRIRVSGAGQSEFWLELSQVGADTRIEAAERRVALLHRPFVPRVEAALEALLTGLGAVRDGQR
jgi:hypothetical protein